MTTTVFVWLPLVALAGAAGAVLRHLATAMGASRGAVARAWSVAVCNLAGTAVFAAVVARQGLDWTGAPLVLVVGGGFCGGLTTFSTWMVDAVLGWLRRERRLPVVAVVDLVGQLGVGVLLAVLLLSG
jgi:CrcB protein